MRNNLEKVKIVSKLSKLNVDPIGLFAEQISIILLTVHLQGRSQKVFLGEGFEKIICSKFSKNFALRATLFTNFPILEGA